MGAIKKIKRKPKKKTVKKPDAKLVQISRETDSHPMFICSQCDKIFTSSISGRSHLKIHNGKSKGEKFIPISPKNKKGKSNLITEIQGWPVSGGLPGSGKR